MKVIRGIGKFLVFGFLFSFFWNCGQSSAVLSEGYAA
jgi:hypothetical protein